LPDMKPWIILSVLAAMLVAMGIWLVWPEEREFEAPVVGQEEALPEATLPHPVAAPPRETAPVPPEPRRVPDGAEVVTALEEAAKNREAAEGWDQQLSQACKNLVMEEKFEEAQQCYQLRLARDPQDAEAYVERGSLQARMGKLEEAYWDYQKYLELAPNGRRAPQIKKILEQYDEFEINGKVPEVKRDDQRLEAVAKAKLLYQEAYTIQRSDPEEARRKLESALKLLPEDEEVYRNRINRLMIRIGVRGR
jgi:tetratricopeptide (TPR) repeat protein